MITLSGLLTQHHLNIEEVWFAAGDKIFHETTPEGEGHISGYFKSHPHTLHMLSDLFVLGSSSNLSNLQLTPSVSS